MAVARSGVAVTGIAIDLATTAARNTRSARRPSHGANHAASADLKNRRPKRAPNRRPKPSKRHRVKLRSLPQHPSPSSPAKKPRQRRHHAEKGRNEANEVSGVDVAAVVGDAGADEDAARKTAPEQQPPQLPNPRSIKTWDRITRATAKPAVTATRLLTRTSRLNATNRSGVLICRRRSHTVSPRMIRRLRSSKQPLPAEIHHRRRARKLPRGQCGPPALQ